MGGALKDSLVPEDTRVVGRRNRTGAETGLQTSLSNAFQAANQIEDLVIRGKVLEGISQARIFAAQLKTLSQ